MQKQSLYKFFLEIMREFFVEFGILFASLGPILEKIVSKPSDMSAAPERTIPLFTKVSEII